MPDTNPGLVDYTDTIGSVAPRINTTSFHAVYPLVSRVKLSNIVLVIQPGERGQSYFLMDIKAGPLKKSVNVFQETIDIISGALEDDVFPIIHLGELQKAALQRPVLSKFLDT